MKHQATSWTDPESVIINWWHRCGCCKKWRVRAQYIEMYDDHGWWPECLKCAVITLSEIVEIERIKNE